MSKFAPALALAATVLLIIAGLMTGDAEARIPTPDPEPGNLGCYTASVEVCLPDPSDPGECYSAGLNEQTGTSYQGCQSHLQLMVNNANAQGWQPTNPRCVWFPNACSRN